MALRNNGAPYIRNKLDSLKPAAYSGRRTGGEAKIESSAT